MESDLQLILQDLIPVAQYSLILAAGLILAICVLVPMTLFCAILCTYLPGLVVFDFSKSFFSEKLKSQIRVINRKYKLSVSYYLKETVPTSVLSATIVNTLGLDRFFELKSSLQKSQTSIAQFLEENNKEAPILEVKTFDGRENVEELKLQITKLADMIDINAEMLVPDLEVSDEDYDRRKEGKSSLIIFIPLLIFVIFLNTYLLSTFFKDLLGPVNDYLFGWGVPIQLSHVVAFMFTAIEVGIGVYFASTEYHQEKKTTVTSVIRTFAWLVLAMLIFVEFFIYLQLSVYSSLDMNLVEAYFEVSTFEFFMAGWMAVFGPIIVMSLFIFGHQGTNAYMKVMHTDALDSLKKYLDAADQRLTGVNSLAVQIQENLESLKVISSEINIDINEATDITSDVKSHRQSDEVIEQLKKLDVSISAVVSEVKEFADSDTESAHEAFERLHQLPLREQSAYLGFDLIMGFVWIASIIGFGVIGQYLIQDNVSLIESFSTFHLLEFFSSILIALVMSISGYITFQNTSLVLISGRYQIRSTKLQTTLKALAPLIPALVFICFVWLHWGNSNAYLHLLGILLLGLLLFLMGQSMLRSVYATRIALVMFYYQMLTLLIQGARLVTFSVQSFLKFFSYIVKSIGNPWAKLYPTIFHWK